ARDRDVLNAVVVAARHVGFDAAGCDGIHVNAVATYVLGDPLGQRQDTRLGGRVGGTTAASRRARGPRCHAADFARDGADVHDLAGLLLFHVWQDRLDAVESAAQGGVHVAVP